MQMRFSAAHAFVLGACQRAFKGKGLPMCEKSKMRFSAGSVRKSFWKKEWVYVQEVATAKPCITGEVSESFGAQI